MREVSDLSLVKSVTLIQLELLYLLHPITNQSIIITEWITLAFTVA